ncbi:YfhO family protein [Chloroflexota bacterium]
MKPLLRTRQWPGLVKDLLVVAFLLLLCLVFFWQVLTPNPLNRRWFAAGDFTDQFYAFRTFQSQELWSGRLPMWNPHTFSGSPFLADIQSAVYYPIGLLVILLAGKSGLPLIAVEIEVILHYFLASIFVFLFVKNLTKNRLAGLVSGIVYAYGSYLTSYPKLQMAILEGQTWVPLALLSIHLATKAARSSGTNIGWKRASAWLALGGVALGLCALAGHAQTFLLAAYTVVAYMLFSFFPVWRAAEGRRKLGMAAQMLIFPLVGLGIAAAQLLPSLEYMVLSTRAQIGFNQAGGGFLYSDLLALLLPGLRVIYLGILPLILAILGLILKRSRDTAFWGILALLALLLSLGARTSLFRFFYLFVPGFRLFQGQERALQIFSLAAAVLAGYGMAVLVRPMTHKTKHTFARFCRWLVLANVAAVALALSAYWGAVYLAPPESGQVNDLLERSVMLVLMLGLSTGVLWLRLGRCLRGGWLALLVIPLIVLDLFSLNAGRDLQRARARDRFEDTPLVSFLQEQAGPFRVWHEDDLPGNFGCVWGIEETWGISPLYLQRYGDLLRALPDVRARTLLNVEYAVTSGPDLADGELVEAHSDPEKDSYLHRIREPGQAAYVVYSAEVEADDAAALGRLASPDFDPRHSVILSEDPGLTLTGDGQAVVQILERAPNRLSLQVETSADGILVLSEVYYPGWVATVDDRSSAILRADTTLRSIPLVAGSHHVELVYRSWTVVVGLALTALTLVLVIVGVVWLRKRTG